MNRETIILRDDQHWHDLRSRVITSTDVAALFGISPWLTEFELWHRKKNATIVQFEPNTRMVWGNRLESAIALGIAEDYKLTVRPMKEFIQIPEWRMGSSFDYAIGDDGILEVKNVDSLAYKDGWIIEGDNVEAPSHIEIQGQFQMLVSGRSFVNIGALVGGNRVTLIRREADKQIHEAIKAKVAAFWESIDANREPAPDFKADADFIAKMEGYAEPGKILKTEDEMMLALAMFYKFLGSRETEYETHKKAIKARLLLQIGDAEKVQGNGYTISAGVIPSTLVEAFTKNAYRNFKVYLSKQKEQK